MNQIIMILTNGFDPDVRVYKEGKYLINKGFQVTILCWDRDLSKNHPESEKVDGIHIVRFPIASVYGTGIKQIPAFFKYIKCCKQYIQDNPCDYLHCNDIDGALVGYIVGRRKAKIVFDMHEFYEKGNSLWRWLIRKLTIFLIKQSIAALYENNIYLDESYFSIRKKLYPLRNYPDSKMISAVPKSKSNQFRIGYHGVVRDQILEFTALFEAVKDMDDVRVDINGGGMDLSQLLELQKKYKNVYVNGPYDGIKESTKLYAKTDLLFCEYNPYDPNYHGDAEVIKFYEAIFTGTPLLITKNIGMSSKVEKNGFGLACNTRDSADIKKAIEKIKSNASFWEDCHKNELAYASDYSWEKAVTILDKIYQYERVLK
ncbi:MAG: glycosyltransferase family 4 protein [Oscillospiraceae bacterium]|nr:glycosyltransferase family 4 protein [Oscillospiraceae bacterium]